MLIICFCFVAFAQTVPSASDVLTPVYAKAQASGKKVLLIFHASWCGWCRKMDSSLVDPSIKTAINRSYEIAHLTVLESPNKKALENPGGMELLNKLGGAEQGLPYWAVLNADGTLLHNSQYKPGENTGCPANAVEVNYFVDVLKKTSKMTEGELEKVRVRFRRNEG